MFRRPPRIAPATQAAAAAHRSALIDELGRRREIPSRAQLYLLIDCGMSPAVRRFAIGRLSNFEHAVLLERTPEEHLAERFSPWLLAIPEQITDAWLERDDDPLLNDLCLLAQESPAISWLWSSNDLHALTNHLRGFLGGILGAADDSGDEGEVFLRYYDARVLATYQSILTPLQRTAFMRPIAMWALWNRHLTWKTWSGPDEPADPPDPALVRYTPAQQTQLALASQPDKILHRIFESYGEDADSNRVRNDLLNLPQDARHRKIAALVDEARALRLRSDADLMLYAVLAIDIHPRFIDHPEMQAKVVPGLRAGDDFAALLDNVSATAWHELDTEQANLASPSQWTVSNAASA